MPDVIKIQMVLDKVQIFLAKWLDCHLKGLYKVNFWQSAVLNALIPEQRINVEENGAGSLDDLDFATLVAVFLGNFKALRKELHLDLELSDMAKHVKKIRNLYAHKNSKAIKNPNLKKVKYHFETLHQFMDGLGAEVDLLREIDELNISSVDSKLRANSALQSTVTTSNGVKISVSSGLATSNFTNAVIGNNNGRCVPKIDTNGNNEKGMVRTNVLRSKELPKILVLQERKGRTKSSMGDSRLDTNSGNIRKKQCKIFSDNSFQSSQRNELQQLSIRQNPSVLYESIRNCLRLDFEEYKFGACVLYRPEDKIPVELSLGVGWQWAIALQIFEKDKTRVASEVAKFNRVGIKYNVVGDYAVWKYVDSCQTTDASGEIASTVCLPNWYIEAIASIEGAEYQTDRLGVRQTLQASDEVRRLYLGTYAPRSFAETVATADYLFATYPDRVEGLGSEVSIYDIGSGSGAATMGLIWSLKKLRLNQIQRIIIHAVDGNEWSLKLFEELLPRLRDKWRSVDIVLRTTLVSSVDEIVSKYCMQADFVISSKFLQELKSEELVLRVVETANNALKANGIALWIANPGIDPDTDAFMKATRSGGDLLIVEPSLDISVLGIPGHSESIKESVSCKVQSKRGEN
jgi:hypothetical protein